jgi:hypothetical protein
MKHSSKLAAAVCLSVVAAACSRQASAPASPTATAVTQPNLNPDATLKVTAPQNQSPPNGQTLSQGDIVLVVKNSRPLYDPALKLTYSFEIWSDGTDIPGFMRFAGPAAEGSDGTTSLTVPNNVELTPEHVYKWRVRSYVGLDNSEYSAWTTFVAPTNTGYIRGNELYDPLDNGTTVGRIFGPVTFLPGQGVRLESKSSWIEYVMPATATTGEFSAIFTGLTVKNVESEDPKDRVLTMREGFAPMNDNRFRFSIDVRGNGAAAWRFLTGSTTSYIETVGAGERPPLGFRRANTYFIRGVWNGSRLQVTYKDLTNGTTLYDAGKGYGGTYRPAPQVVYVGSPWVGGERGEPSSYDGMVVRQVWMSPNPRPAFANR